VHHGGYVSGRAAGAGLGDGEYRLVATGGSGDSMTVDGPVPVSFDPAVLLG
jgi:hypothetical protein